MCPGSQGHQKVFSIQSQRAPQARGQVLFCSASVLTHNTVIDMTHGDCHFAELRPPTGTQHSHKHQQSTPTGGDNPVGSTALPASVTTGSITSRCRPPRKAGNHPQTLRAMAIFRNTAANFPSALHISRGSYQTLRGTSCTSEFCFCELLTIPPGATFDFSLCPQDLQRDGL